MLRPFIIRSIENTKSQLKINVSLYRQPLRRVQGAGNVITAT